MLGYLLDELYGRRDCPTCLYRKADVPPPPPKPRPCNHCGNRRPPHHGHHHHDGHRR